jgi:hypothetical protein
MQSERFKGASTARKSQEESLRKRQQGAKPLAMKKNMESAPSQNEFRNFLSTTDANMLPISSKTPTLSSRKRSKKRKRSGKRKKYVINTSYFEHIMDYFKNRVQLGIKWATTRVHRYLDKHPLWVSALRRCNEILTCIYRISRCRISHGNC